MDVYGCFRVSRCLWVFIAHYGCLGVVHIIRHAIFSYFLPPRPPISHMVTNLRHPPPFFNVTSHLLILENVFLLTRTKFRKKDAIDYYCR